MSATPEDPNRTVVPAEPSLPQSGREPEPPSVTTPTTAPGSVPPDQPHPAITSGPSDRPPGGPSPDEGDHEWQTVVTPRGSALTRAGASFALDVPLTIAGRYELSHEIARGGMGVIYQATDTAFGREVAVKVLADDGQVRTRGVARFVTEARITGQLQHPAIPPVHDVGTLLDGRPFLVMKLIKGQSLSTLLNGRPDVATDRGRFVAVFEQICQAVGYAHAHRVIHRDLKPANIMVGSFGETQVMDWGVAKVMGETPPTGAPSEIEGTTAPGTAIGIARGWEDATRAGSILGTPGYMPPEQAIGAVDKIDEQSDVFGLGAILCVILTGRSPYLGPDAESTRQLAARAKLEDAFRRLDDCGAEPELVGLCKRCLAAEKVDRPKDAAEVAAAVAAFRAEADDRARRAEIDRVRAEGEQAKATAEAREQGKRRRAQLALAGAVGLLLLGAGGAAWWQDRQVADRQIAEQRRQIAEERQQQAEEKAALVRESSLANEAQVHLYGAIILMPGGRLASPKDAPDVIEHLDQAVELFETARREFPGSLIHRYYLGMTYRFLALVKMMRFSTSRVVDSLAILDRAEECAIPFENPENLARLPAGRGPRLGPQLRNIQGCRLHAYILVGRCTEGLMVFGQLYPETAVTDLSFRADPVVPSRRELDDIILRGAVLGHEQLTPEAATRLRLILIRGAEEEQSKIMFATRGKEDFPRLTQDAKFLAESRGVAGDAVYNAACAFSLASAAASADADTRERQAARAVQYLRRLQEGGYFEHPTKGKKSTRALEMDSDLDALRGRDDFRALLQTVKAAKTDRTTPPTQK